MKNSIFTAGFKSLFVALLLFFSSSTYVQGQYCCCLVGGCVQNFFWPGNDCNFWCGVNLGAPNYPTPACVGSSCEVVPIELEYFRIEPVNNKHILISWGTLSELNNEGFEIQRASGTALNWETISFFGGQGTSERSVQYSYLDESPTPGINYYRLLQIDFDGTETFSDIESASISQKLEVDIWPTWAKDYVFVKFEEDTNSRYFVEVYDLVGRRVISQDNSSSFIDIRELPLGQYIVNVFVDYQRHTMRFVKVE